MAKGRGDMGRLLAADGSALEWDIAGTEKSGFNGFLKVLPPAGTVSEAEAHKGSFASRADAVAWLQVCARARGFDGRGIK